jgi:superfamily II DNA or RNA helicase
VITCRISNSLEIAGLPSEIQNWFETSSSFNTFAFSTDDIPANLKLFERVDKTTIKVPRGFLSMLQTYCNSSNQKLKIIYETAKEKPTKFKIDPSINYKTGVFSYQDRVVKDLLQYNHCRLQVPAGGGKTVISCLLIGKLNKGPTLFLVNKDRLLRQFVNTVKKVLGLKEEDIGIIKAKKFSIKPITVGSLQTMGKETFDLEAIKEEFHTVFFDECHISAALTYRRVLLGLAPYRLYGLSATPEHYASEELNNLMDGLLGPIAVVIKEDEIPGRMLPETATIETGKSYYYDVSPGDPSWRQHKQRNNLYNAIAEDNDRNDMIASDTKKLVKKGHKVLITVSRVAHGAVLKDKLTKLGIKVSFPYKIIKRKGKEDDQKVDHKQLDLDVDSILAGDIDVLIGTYSLFQTGFDCANLSAVQLASPFSGANSTILIQVFGRIQRYSFDKTQAVALDYTDDSFPNNTLRDWANDRVEEMNKRFGPHTTIYKTKNP